MTSLHTDHSCAIFILPFLTDRMWCTHEVDKALEMVLVVRSAMSDQYEVAQNRLRSVRVTELLI